MRISSPLDMPDEAARSDIFIPHARLRPRGSMGEARRGTPEGPDRPGPEIDREGSEGRTLAERFISAFQLPYALGCFLLGFIVFGFLNSLLAKYVESASLPQALQTA